MKVCQHSRLFSPCRLTLSAYQLVSSDTYGEQATATIASVLDITKRSMCLFFAGYEEDMRQFIRSNEGLSRRFPHKLMTETLSPDALKKEVVKYLCEKKGIKVVPKTTASLELSKLITELHASDFFMMSNAQGAHGSFFPPPFPFFTLHLFL